MPDKIMNTQHRAKFNWYKLLGALAIFSGTIGAVESLPVNATIAQTKSSSNAHGIVDLLEQPIKSTQPNYLSLDNDVSQPVARRGHHRRSRRFGGHHRRFRRFGGHHRRFRRFGGHHRRFRH